MAHGRYDLTEFEWNVINPAPRHLLTAIAQRHHRQHLRPRWLVLLDLYGLGGDATEAIPNCI